MTPAEGGDPAPQRYRLPTGWLDLRIQGQQLPHELFRIAARQNPKRGFLFVSTVLGRHIPVRPSLHREVLRHLASACLPHLPEGPILVMGFAETAIGLGAGVAQEIARHRPGASYLPTTRHPVPGQGWLGFSEPHSHASAHEIMRPTASALPDGLTLVLVDDEMTTGTTVANLVTALQTGGLQPARILLVTLTDWSGGRAAALVTARSAIPDVRSISLMQGGLRLMLWRSRKSRGVARQRRHRPRRSRRGSGWLPPARGPDRGRSFRPGSSASRPASG